MTSKGFPKPDAVGWGCLVLVLIFWVLPAVLVIGKSLGWIATEEPKQGEYYKTPPNWHPNDELERDSAAPWGGY